jgi:hypothetical protein
MTTTSTVEFRLRMGELFDDLPRAQRRRMCRCIKEVWIDVVGPNPRYARGFFVALFNAGRITWLEPTERHFARFRRMLRKMLAPGYVASLLLV